jgi:transmembrane sensor
VVEIKRLQVPQESPVQLAANTVAVAPPDAPISTEPVASVRVSRDLAWREGRLAFDNEPLADAARQFARYSAIEILISPDLENQTVTGLFVSNDPVGFARAVAISLNLQLEVNSEGVHLSREQARR